MYTLIVTCCFLGFFALYNTSKKAKLSKSGKVEQWLQTHPRTAKQIGVLLMVVSMVAFIWKNGWGVGGFSAVLLIMTISSLVVAIAPLYYINLRTVALLISLSLVLELIIF